MDSFKKHHHKRHGGHHHHHHDKKQFNNYQTILDLMQPQPTTNQMYLDEKPIQLEEQKNFIEPNQDHHHHHRREFNKDFKHKDHHSHRGGFGGRNRSRDGFKKHHDHHNNNFNNHHNQQKPEESIPLETITNSAQYQNIANLEYTDDSKILSNAQLNDAAFAQHYDLLTTKSTMTTASSTEIANSIDLSIKLKKQIIQANPNEWQTFPLLVSLAANNLKSLHKTPVDLVCVIDHSGSMAGTKIQLVIQSFQSLFRYLGDADRLSIVIFDNNASRLVPLMNMTNENKVIITNALKSVKGEGGTDINLGMMHAFQIIKSRRYINTATSIFLLSDGLDTKAQHKVKASCQAFDLPSNVSIHTFGFGGDHDPRLMTDIADLRDGNFYFVNKLETVDECFIDCLGGIQSSISQNVIISVQAEQSHLKGVQLLDSYGNSSMWTYHKDQCSTKLINLMAGRQKDYILKLRLPAIRRKSYEPATQVKIASVEAVILGLDGYQIVKRADLYVTLLDENENIALYDNRDDFEVMKNYYRVKGAFMMNKARQLADEKQWIAARKSLQSFKDEVQESALKDDPFIKNLLQDLEKAIINVDPEVYWRVGKHNLLANQRAQMYQKSNLDSKNNYQNALQIQMLQMLKK